MFPYIATYQKAYALSRVYLSSFNIPAAWKIRYGAKSGNLAMCFLGFSAHKGEQYFQRSAELGVLASIFDLTSDGLKFRDDAVQRFRRILSETLDPELACLSLEALDQKRSGSFKFDGLDRGVPTLKIIIQHLRAEKFWPREREVFEVGILCQIVDDIIDYHHDMAKGELNFLRHDSRAAHLSKLLQWDYEEQFSESQYPFVLFQVFKRAKATAAKLAESGLHTSSRV